MLGQGWLTLRQAREALRTGRLEDAQRLLSLPVVQAHRRCGKLLCRLAQRYAARGERHLKNDEQEFAWRDLFQAECLQTSSDAADRLRQALTRAGLAEVKELLVAGEPARAAEAVARLRARDVHAAELHKLQETIKEWLAARDQADHGSFGPAIESLEHLARLHDGLPALLRYREQLQGRHAKVADLLPRLHTAVESARWREVVQLAEQVLLLAPHHPEARRARSRAWKAIEPATVAMHGANIETAPSRAPADPNPLRFLLWIDGVGGYLVCLGGRLTFGQAIAGDRIDVPLLADVSRLHASLTRDAEGYVLEAVRPVQVNAQAATRALLKPDDRVTLGSSCQFVFRLPVPVSATARLDLVSGHRVPLGVDGVLLMADTLVLGDGPQVHVMVPDLAEPLVFFRHKEGLGLRHSGRLKVNGHATNDRSVLPIPSRVEGEEISFAVEAVG